MQMVGSIHLKPEVYKETIEWLATKLAKAQVDAANNLIAGHNQFTIAVALYFVVVCGVRPTNNMLARLHRSISPDGRLFMPMDKCGDPLHATRIAALDPFGAMLVREFVRHLMNMRRYLSKQDTRIALDSSLESPPGFLFIIEYDSPGKCYMNARSIEVEDILSGLPKELIERRSEGRVQLRIFLEKIQTPQAVKAGIMGHSRERAVTFGSQRWWHMRDFAEFAGSSLELYSEYLGYPTAWAKHAKPSKNMTDGSFCNALLALDDWISVPSKPRIQKDRIGDERSLIEDFRKGTYSLRELLGSEAYSNNVIRENAARVAGNNSSLSIKLCKAVGVPPSERDLARVRRQRDNMALDHGPNVFLDNIKLHRARDNLLRELQRLRDRGQALAKAKQAGLLQVLIPLESGITDAQLARHQFLNLFSHEHTFRFQGKVFTESHWECYDSQGDRPTHRLPRTVTERTIAANLRSLYHTSHGVERLVKSKVVGAETAKWLDIMQVPAANKLEDRMATLCHLVSSETYVSIPGPIRCQHSGEPLTSPLPRGEFVAYHSKQRVPQPGFSYECTPERACELPSREASLSETDPSTAPLSQSAFSNLLRTASSNAETKTGSKAKPYRQALLPEIMTIEAQYGYRFHTPHLIVLSFARGFAEFGLSDPRAGVASTFIRYLEEVIPVSWFVFGEDDDAIYDEDVMYARLQDALNARNDRAYAEPRVEMMFAHAESYGILDAPPPSFIYQSNGQVVGKLARPGVINGAARDRAIEALYVEDDPSSLIDMLLATLQSRLYLRFSEAYNLQLQDISVRSGRIVVTPRSRGRHRGKSIASNRWVLALSELSPIEQLAFDELAKIQSSAAKARDAIFRPGDPAAAEVHQTRLQQRHRIHLKNVTGNSEITLHSGYRKSGIAQVINRLSPSDNRASALSGIRDPKRNEEVSLPLSTDPQGFRFMNASMGIGSQAGHKSFSQTTIPSYYPFGSELYSSYWGRLNLVGIPESTWPIILGDLSLRRDSYRNILRSAPDTFTLERIKSEPYSHSKTIPPEPQTLHFGLSDVGHALKLTVPANKTVAEFFATKADSIRHEITSHATSLMDSYDIDASDLGLSSVNDLSCEPKLLNMLRREPLLNALSFIEREREIQGFFKAGGLWQKSITRHRARNETYLYIENAEETPIILRCLYALGYSNEYLSCQANEFRRSAEIATAHGLVPSSYGTNFLHARKQDAVIIRLHENTGGTAIARDPVAWCIAGWLTAAYFESELEAI